MKWPTNLLGGEDRNFIPISVSPPKTGKQMKKCLDEICTEQTSGDTSWTMYDSQGTLVLRVQKGSHLYQYGLAAVEVEEDKLADVRYKPIPDFYLRDEEYKMFTVQEVSLGSLFSMRPSSNNLKKHQTAILVLSDAMRREPPREPDSGRLELAFSGTSFDVDEIRSSSTETSELTVDDIIDPLAKQYEKLGDRGIKTDFSPPVNSKSNTRDYLTGVEIHGALKLLGVYYNSEKGTVIYGGQEFCVGAIGRDRMAAWSFKVTEDFESRNKPYAAVVLYQSESGRAKPVKRGTNGFAGVAFNAVEGVIKEYKSLLVQDGLARHTTRQMPRASR